MSPDRPVHPDELLAQARRRLAVGDTAGAERLAARVLATAPHLRRALLLRAKAQLRLGRADDVLHTLDAVTWYSPDGDLGPVTASRVIRSGALAQLGRTSEAVDELRTALTDRPDDRGLRIRLGALLLEADRPDEAIRELEPARGQRRHDRTVDRLLAEACRRTGDYDRAIDLCQRLYRRGDRGAASVTRIARLYVAAGRIADALRAYDALYRAGALEGALAHEAADLAIEIGDADRAHRWLQAALVDAPDDVEAERRIARLHLGAGRFADAARMYWRLSRRDDDDGSGLAGLIVTALCAGRYAMADRCLARYAERFDADTRRSQMTVLWLAATPGRLINDRTPTGGADGSQDVFAVLVADAGRTIERALSRHPGYADLHFHRAACHAALGDEAGEAASLEQSLAINPGYFEAARRRIARLLADGDTAGARAVLGSLAARRDPAELESLQRQVAAAESRAA